MRVCIVGGGGYLGCELAARLQSHGAHTVILDVSFSGHPTIQLDEKLTTRIQGSVLDEAKLREALHACESCFHLAAYGMSGLQAFNRDLINRINVDGTALLMEYCKRVGVPRFIYASSVGVIFTGKELVNATEDYPYPEESEYFSAYCSSKARAERLVLAANCDELRTVALRLRGIYGPGEPRSTDRAVDIIYKGLYIATFAQKGRAITQYSGVHNVTHAMCQADKELARPFSRCAGKVYHIVDANPVDSFLFWMPLITALSQTPPSIRLPFSLIYFVAYIAECLAVWFGIPPVMNRLEVNLVGITNTYSIERAIKDFDYNPTKNHDLTEIVDYYTKYYKDRPGTKLDVRRTLKILIASAMLLFIVIRCYFS
ncbi:3-beta hydroxysteroid dehydrogenase/isomerase family protein [Ancylostoma caninum]|uniref:3-beta hydroxysteroid dehydrogenase/isomerase family protein n=1 Tax=Ancylostoma caninum TaxID=29170 RepID=A0A368G506_ANCCA|nr:3-beta hydroxysteroid dehydrogenase/isomerase family protein [Ancylostoma caninum]